MITVNQNNAVMSIVIDRVDKKNAITLSMYQQMADAITAAASDRSIKVIVLSGAGDNFTAGNDLADFLSNPNLDVDSSVYQFLQAIITCPLPLIAAIKGFAVGIGATLLLHCEQVFADETAIFSYPFINLGLVPEAGSSLLLPQLIGYQKAADLLLTGDAFNAQKALELGVIATLVSEGCVVDAANLYAQKLSSKPRATLIKIKTLLRAELPKLQQQVEDELVVFKDSLQGPEAKEAMLAFMEKRPANFDDL